MTSTGTYLRPADEAELAEAIRTATGTLHVRGGGTRTPRHSASSGTILETGGLSGIRLYEPGALTLVAGAGTPLAGIEAALAGEGQRLAFEPMEFRGLLGTSGEPTIGGVVATNASGPRRIQVGACRDHLLGVRFVDGNGAIVSNGGRVMKNVTGYDLVKLMAGSRATLGVLSEVSLKVLPAPAAQATLVFDSLAPEHAVSAMSGALGSPWEVSGAARLPDGRTVLRIEGFESSVAYRIERLARHLSHLGTASRLEGPDSATLWRGVRDVGPFHGVDGDVWRLSCRPSQASELIARANVPALMDWGGGLIWLLTATGTDLRAVLGPFAGHATLTRAAAATRRAVEPLPTETEPVAGLTRGLRAQFDPRRLFAGAL